jgi:hypothetical protein
MKEPSPRASRLALTAGILAVAAIGGGGFLLGQRSARDPDPIMPAAVAPAPSPSPVASTAGVLGRVDLLALAGEAADASARGDAMPAGVRDAVGKRFAISLPFGCDGPAEPGSVAAMQWLYDDKAGALRLTVTPVTWSPIEWWTAEPRSKAETVEGFWIARPWTRSEACPASPAALAPPDAEPVTLTGQTLAIGQVFGAEDARQGRSNGKAYESVLRMALSERIGKQGFTLRLTGRLASGPNNSVATCRQPGGADQRPVCLVLVTLAEITITDPASNTVLATWSMDSLRDGGEAR